MKPCPKCGHENLWVGWGTMFTDIPPFKDEQGNTHQHSHGILRISLQCKACRHEWIEQQQVPLRCYCGWFNGN